jgi:SAM-dependent methyltransferase
MTPETSGDRAIWDRIFKDGEKATGGRYFYQLALDQIVPGETICDAGCGMTFYLDDVMTKCGPGGLFIGIDFSRVALTGSAALAAGYPNARLILADILRLPLPDRAVHRVFCAETLPYLLDDVEEALRELARVAKKEVIFSLHTRGAYEIEGTETEFRGNIVIEHKADAKPPRRVFEEKEIVDLVKKAGGLELKTMRPFRWGEIYHVPDGMEWPWFLPDPERIALYYVSAEPLREGDHE